MSENKRYAQVCRRWILWYTMAPILIHEGIQNDQVSRAHGYIFVYLHALSLNCAQGIQIGDHETAVSTKAQVVDGRMRFDRSGRLVAVRFVLVYYKLLVRPMEIECRHGAVQVAGWMAKMFLELPRHVG